MFSTPPKALSRFHRRPHDDFHRFGEEQKAVPGTF
jgi:hypothetical protein